MVPNHLLQSRRFYKKKISSINQEQLFIKELVEVIAKALVDDPDAVEVTESEKHNEIVLELHVADHDMGRVIGRQGRIAKAIRSVLKAMGSKENKRVMLNIVD